MQDNDWQPIATAPERVRIQTKIHDEKGPRVEQPLIHANGLWWTDEGTYIYYDPTHWRYIR